MEQAAIKPPDPARRGGAKGRKIRRPSRILRDLRWVYLNPEASNASEAQKRLQQVFRDNPQVFLAQLNAAERGHAAGGVKVEQRKAESEKPVDSDPGEERVRAMMEQLLAEAERAQRKEEEGFVADGLCVTCGQAPVPGLGRAGRVVSRSSA
jgi:hypothetical protein